jgi:uncharacterized membrane protein YcgQ (UPF0703/DUF1980 family)
MVTDATFVQAITFVGVLAGVIYRTVYPYFEKVQEMESHGEQPIKFLFKYKMTAIISIVVAAATAVVGNVQIPMDSNGIVNAGSLFVAAFFTGYGANSILNRVSFKDGDSNVDKSAAQKQAREDKKASSEKEEQKPSA